MASPTPVWDENGFQLVIAGMMYGQTLLLTLPEREENNRFHRAKLEHRIERRQQVPGGKVEQVQSVQGQRNRDVVDDGDVNVATISTGIEREM